MHDSMDDSAASGPRGVEGPLTNHLGLVDNVNPHKLILVVDDNVINIAQVMSLI